jgi:hypothetical protein
MTGLFDPRRIFYLFPLIYSILKRWQGKLPLLNINLGLVRNVTIGEFFESKRLYFLKNPDFNVDYEELLIAMYQAKERS